MNASVTCSIGSVSAFVALEAADHAWKPVLRGEQADDHQRLQALLGEPWLMKPVAEVVSK
jgi:hypothetical protein